ncbi:hypothetical protein [Kitasatospora sp. MBT63]|uniref:hypothetical protein n=1 Tax=Kitasatospora sp. MBT63 TaxID=1444768 RepID=UPI00053B47CD|nr:hypothetical protein [Kitasatospora sp. MBT63]
MQPTIGRIVHYVLSESDADLITRRRAARAAREAVGVETLGNHVEAGQVFPATIVRVWPDTVSLQVALDGPDGAWVTSRTEGTGPGTWAWPPRSQ